MVKERSNFGNSGRQTQSFGDFGLKKAKIWELWSRKRQLMTVLMYKLAKPKVSFSRNMV